jgi:hypothetical protein
VTNKRIKLIFGLVLLSLSLDLQAQPVKHELDSLHSLVLNDTSRFLNNKIFQQTKQLLEQAKSNPHRTGVTDAYLLLAKISFNLNRESEALKYFKLYMIESDRINTDSIVDLTNRQLATYENEVKALLLLQQQLEEANQKLFAEKNSLMQKNSFIYYGLLSSIIIGLIIVFLTNRRSNRKRLSGIKEAASTIGKGDGQVSITDQIGSYKAELQQITLLSYHLEREHSPRLEELQYVKDTFVFNKAKELTGGDGLWFYSVKGKSVIVVFDAPGFGASGALLVSIIRNLLSELVQKMNTLAPALILTQLEAGFRQQALTSAVTAEGIKAGVCTIDKKLKSVDYAGADFSLFVYDQGELRRIDGDIHPLLSPKRQQGYFQTERIKIGRKTRLYLSTDGFWNQTGGRNKLKFKRSGFEKALLSMADQPLEEQEFIISKLFTNWQGSGEQTDDVLVLGLEF